MDLSKAFNTLNHEPLKAKLEAYGLSINPLRYIRSYLNQRLQRIGVNNSFSLWKDIIAGVRKGSLLGPILFTYTYIYIYIYIYIMLRSKLMKE